LALRSDDEEEALTIRYLLGTLPEPDRIRLEESFFTDDERYEQMLAVEDELMYACLQGELSAEDRARFEERFQRDPSRRGRAEFARALLQAAGEAPAGSAATTGRAAERAIPWWRWRGSHWEGRWALRAAILALAALSGWLAYEAVDLRREGQRLLDARLAQEREWQRDANRARAARAGAARERESESRTVVSLILASGLTRGEGESARLAVPTAADLLRLQVEVGRVDYPSYRAIIRTAEGGQVWGRDGLRGSAVGSIQVVIVDVPASILTRGDYELSLSGLTPAGRTEEVGTYYFGIVRR
jgi:hypothetical protein